MRLQQDVNIFDILYIVGLVKEETGRSANQDDRSISTARATASGFEQALEDEEIYEEITQDYLEIEEDEPITGKSIVQTINEFLKEQGFNLSVESLDKLVTLVDIDDLYSENNKDFVYNLIYKYGYYYYIRYDEDDYILTKSYIVDGLTINFFNALFNNILIFVL